VPTSIARLVQVGASAALTLLLSLLASLGHASEGTSIVWQIGSPNGSSGEFRDEFEEYANAELALVYLVG